ncbi:MAG: hypothetical protein A2045_13795 [Rhodocyclales bacterium GWA2_65_20]|nr:MAG: hypothetical protein A2045_13795 [Rhodocyclales bacterium GWA2_65_20]
MNTKPFHDRPPKILPWLARKAGITEHRAEILWHAAQRYATRHGGETATPAYWRAAMDRLLELIAAETLRADAASFGLRHWARVNARFWQAPVALLDAASLLVLHGTRLVATFGQASRLG